MRNKCKKTLSGKHVFMPMFGEWVDEYQLVLRQIWKAHGVPNPQKCIACEIINDLEPHDKEE